MPHDDELRRILHSDRAEPHALDAALIVRKARARRRPKQVVAGVTGVLAAAALIVPVALGTSFSTTFGPAALESAEDAGGVGEARDIAMTDSETSRSANAPLAASAEDAQQCGAPPVRYASHPEGLTLTLQSPAGAGGEGIIRMDAVLRNMGDENFSGTVDASLVVALVRDGVVVATSSTGTELDQVALELAPRATRLVLANLNLAECSPGGETLGPLVPGEYLLTAAIDVTGADGRPVRVGATPARFDVLP